MITAGMTVSPKYRARGVHFARVDSLKHSEAEFAAGDVGVVQSVIPSSRPGWPDVAIVKHRGEEFGIHVTDVVEVSLW